MPIPDFLNTRLPLLSIRVRGEWQKDKIFQVIHGKQFIREYTEYDGSAKGHLIPFQSKFAAAVWNWQHMPESEKQWFRARESKLGLRISGYNYFISLYMRDKLEAYMGYPDPHHLSHEKGGTDEINCSGLVGRIDFVDRGDPSNFDFTLTDFTTDGVWHSLDVSAIVPAAARMIQLGVSIEDNIAASKVQFRKNGNSNEINTISIETQVKNIARSANGFIPAAGNGLIDYKADNATFISINLYIKGWLV